LLEGSISAELWRWVTLEPVAQAEITKARSRLADDLMCFLSRAFREIEFTRAKNIWCDGVLGLLVFPLNQLSFRVVAAAFCPSALEPVELMFHYSETGGLKPLRIILRFGFADEVRGSRKSSRSQKRKGFDAGAILDSLPETNQQWAVAVELTSI
jgi:hypothetical protein